MANPSVVLVTGASSGNGEAIATRLRDGHHVSGTSRTGGGMRERVEMLTMDVCSHASVQSCVEGLPASAFEAGTRRGFNLDREGF